MKGHAIKGQSTLTQFPITCWYYIRILLDTVGVSKSDRADRKTKIGVQSITSIQSSDVVQHDGGDDMMILHCLTVWAYTSRSCNVTRMQIP